MNAFNFYRLFKILTFSHLDQVNHGMDHPLKFPNGELFLSLVPQLVIAPFAVDKVPNRSGNSICNSNCNVDGVYSSCGNSNIP